MENEKDLRIKMLRYEKLRNSDLISEEFGTKQYVKNLTVHNARIIFKKRVSMMQLNGQALISDVVVSSSVGRALAMKAGDPGSSPGRDNNFLGQGYWPTLVIQLLEGPEV